MGNKGTAVGYARVSTADQNPNLQLDALRSANCDRIFEERASGAQADRPELARALDHLRDGDTFVVWRLDRLGRSLKDLVRIVNELEARGVGFQSLQESIDSTTPSGRLTFHIFASLAEFERELVRERTRAGLAAARSRGRRGGRPSVMTPKKLAVARALLKEVDSDGKSAHTYESVAETIGVSRSTIYRALRKAPESSSAKSTSK